MTTCTHPPARIFTWFAYDRTLCAACCVCGEILAGDAQHAQQWSYPMSDFNLKFMDGTPVPDNYPRSEAERDDYAQQLAAWVHEAAILDITEDDELTMGAYWVPGWSPTIRETADDLEIKPFRIDRITHGACPRCRAETEIQIGHDITIRGNTCTPGPLKALEECPNCGTAVLDPTPYLMPHVR